MLRRRWGVNRKAAVREQMAPNFPAIFALPPLEIFSAGVVTLVSLRCHTHFHGLCCLVLYFCAADKCQAPPSEIPLSMNDGGQMPSDVLFKCNF
jgi:hypothetical protein